MKKAAFISFKNFPEAGTKLGALDSNTSALLELFSLISTNTAVSDTAISSAFQAPQAVVAPTSSVDGRLIGSANNAYIQALQALEGSIKNLTASPTGANDPAAAGPVASAAINAEGAAENLRNGFLPDPSGGMDRISFALLEDPIESAKGLASNFGAVAAGGGAKTFCAQIGPVLSKFPFNPDATTDATPDEAAQVFAPTTGAFAQFANSAAIKALVMQQGNTFIKAPTATGTLNGSFLSFMNSAQRISSTLFPSGNQPQLDFTLTEVKSPGSPDAVVNIDNQQITTAGQKLNFHWVSSPSGHYSLSNPGNTRTSTPSSWSAFHLALGAAHVPPDRLKIDLQTNNQSNGVILLDVSGPGAPLLNRDFMKGFHCVSQVAH
jgi:type VI secretion system protein ImpL